MAERAGAFGLHSSRWTGVPLGVLGASDGQRHRGFGGL